MECILNDSCIDLENYDTSSIIKLQAQFRGYLVRKQMKSLRDSYLGLVKHIESNKTPTVIWERDRPSLPKFFKHKKLVNFDHPHDASSPEFHSNRVIIRDSQGDITDRVCDLDTRVKSVEIPTSHEADKLPQLPHGTDICFSHNEMYNLSTNGTCSNLNNQDNTSPMACLLVDPPVHGSASEQPVRLHSQRTAHVMDGETSHVASVPHLGDHDGESDTSSLTEVTSIWESQLDSRMKPEREEIKDINSASILEVRKNIAMELLWVQQAINSRKNYLRLKSQME
ncbi:uncharacterized protein LOC124139713 isoform X1 [Haliotis rufescens]|uniref:uncharacterized protein LOC124139713 isoform X1 n=2 Tax=Haliotis rufescens TaxID=6454 RepID=UPI00201EF628|nr:uncharacterized protein LOC124139713 isoform X1 [Haliotis rufescens]